MEGEETSSACEIDRNIFTFDDEVISADKFYDYTDLLSNSDVPIVIDNGNNYYFGDYDNSYSHFLYRV